jgi:CRISPR/Cas system endoribonuclease Cas6 (RAMP superfamily)
LFLFGDKGERGMQSFIYSNVGFRCETVYKELHDHLKTKKEINKIVLDDSKKLLNDCLRIENDARHAIYLTTSNDEEFESILYEYILEKKDKDIIPRLKRIASNLENIDTLKEPQINEMCSFFGSLVELCKDRSQFNHVDDDLILPGFF